MELLKQNSKIKKSSNKSLTIFNFGIPAVKTCPMAGACKVGCYATQGTYNFPAVKKAYETRYQVSLLGSFTLAMSREIVKKLEKHPKMLIRIHDSGDFYNNHYLHNWLSIITIFPEVKFYAYTKRVDLFKNLELPENFRVIFSYGGKLDHMIDTEKDFHAKVFESLKELKAAGYVNGTLDDKVAAIGKKNKVGLVYHGQKRWENTKWNR